MKTKIIATLGPASFSSDMLYKLVAAGARIFRLNFSHGGADQFVEIVKNIREIEKKVGIPIAILQDLSGPKIRIGTLDVDSYTFISGDQALLGPKKPNIPLNIPFIPFDRKEILEGLEEGDRLVLADGTLQFIVANKAPGGFIIEAQNAGIVTSRKGLALPGKSLRLPALTDKDKVDLKDGIALGVDAVALSFVQTPEDILAAKEIIHSLGSDIPVCAKLERQTAVDRLEEILAVTDIVMVARGDLGVECPLAQLPAMQKRIIRACNEANKPVIVATQMLLSMVNNPVPTRAETTDVANAVLDGADCVMLSEETAMGNFPVETVDFMSKITTEAEALLAEGRQLSVPESVFGKSPDFFAYCACLLAEKPNVSAIVSHSMSGSAGRCLSAYRPTVPVYVLTPSETVLRHLNFSWGVYPQLADVAISDHLERIERFIDATPRFLQGDQFIITAEQAKPEYKASGTNLVKKYRK